MDTDSLLYHIKKHDFYPDIARDVKERFDMSGFTDSIPLLMGYNRKVTRLMKDELGGNIMTGFVALRQKSYAYTKLDNKEDKRCEGIKKALWRIRLVSMITRIAYPIHRVEASIGRN